MSKVPDRALVSCDTPLRLAIAALIAFPDRSMTASGLRREALRGRLVIERVAGKDYTTLTDIVYENGFADQSHFIKVFKAFTGKTPKAFKYRS